jgi:hypothetical protein
MLAWMDPLKYRGEYSLLTKVNGSRIRVEPEIGAAFEFRIRPLNLMWKD